MDSLIEALSGYIQSEGLNPSWYQLDSIGAMREDVFTGETPNYTLCAKIERILSLGVLRFHKDHIYGRLNPKQLFGKTYMLPLRKVEGFELLSVLMP